MADSKISDLTDGTAIQSADVLAIGRSGSSLKVLGQRVMPNVGSSPPSSPRDGDIWVYPVDATNGVYWQFVYVSSQATYKWVFVGGPPVVVLAASEFTTTSSTYQDVTSGGSTFPRDGDYDIHFGAELSDDGNWNDVVVAVGASSGSVFGIINISPDGTVTNNKYYSLAGACRKTGVSASSTVKLMLRNGNNSNTVRCRTAFMRFTPARVI